MKAQYEILTWGDCLGGVIPNGSFVLVDPTRNIEIGDIVSVVMEHSGEFNQFARWLGTQDLLGVLKIFLGIGASGAGDPVFLFGQLHPPLIAPIPVRAIAAMHLVDGVATPGEEPEDTSDKAALELLAPFFCKCDPVKPINPGWRPPN